MHNVHFDIVVVCAPAVSLLPFFIQKTFSRKTLCGCKLMEFLLPLTSRYLINFALEASGEAFIENISTAPQREENFLPPANKKVNIGRWEREEEEENLHLKRNIATQKKAKGKKFELFYIEQEEVENENLRAFPQSIFRWKLLYCYLITMKRHPCTLGGSFLVLFLYWISQRVASMGCWRVSMRKQLRYVHSKYVTIK